MINIADFDSKKHYFHSSSDDLLWRIIIADGNRTIHQRIKRILSDQTYDDRGMRIYSAFSAEEASALISKYPDTAILICNISLGTGPADFDTLRHVRKRSGNRNIRIILIGGLPEETAEEHAADEYDISGRIDASGLENGGLPFLIASALKDYDNRMAVETFKKGFDMVLNSIADIGPKSAGSFSSGMLLQLLACMGIDGNAVYCRRNTGGAPDGLGDFYAAAATGKYSDHINKSIADLFPEDLLNDVKKAVGTKTDFSDESHMIFYSDSGKAAESLLVVRDIKKRGGFDRNLTLLFSESLSSFLDTVNHQINLNFYLKEAVLVVDGSNTVIYCNNCFLETFGSFTGIKKGMAMEEFLKNLCRRALKSEDTDYCINLLKDPKADGGEGELRVKSGGERIFSLSVRTVAGITGASAGRMIIFDDITGGKTQIEHLQNECRALSKLNEKNDIILDSISDHTKVKAEENSRLVNSFVEAMLNLSVDSLLLMMNTVTYNSKFRSRIGDIIEMIESEKADVGRFISNIEQKQAEFKNAFKKLASEVDAHKSLKMKETGLDEKEITILQMIASLKSNKEIARELNYEEESIKNKITVIRRKLKLNDRCHLVSFAFRNGLI